MDAGPRPLRPRRRDLGLGRHRGRQPRTRRRARLRGRRAHPGGAGRRRSCCAATCPSWPSGWSTSSTWPGCCRSEEHPHGMRDSEYDALFTPDKPVIFAYHGYPWLIHRLAYRRTGHAHLHVRGYKEIGHHDHAVRHGRPQRPRPLPAGHGRHRPRPGPRGARRRRTAADGGRPRRATTPGSASTAPTCPRSPTGPGRAERPAPGGRPSGARGASGLPPGVPHGVPPAARPAPPSGTGPRPAVAAAGSGPGIGRGHSGAPGRHTRTCR